ncbi:MAG: hypothetical protein WBF45_14825 [Acidobacteriaceae bacterium]
MANLNDPIITQLLEQFQPCLFFDPTEQFFPAVAEEVLNHQSTENWTGSEAHQRGTAVLRAELTATSYAAANVVAGVDDPNGAPLAFNATAPTGIGQTFAYSVNRQDMFLDCAGWDDTTSEVQPGGTAYSTGSVEYLQLLFSGLGNAMNNTIEVASPDPTPIFSIPRSTSPTIYAELDWAGRYPVIDQQRVSAIGGNPDFPSSINDNGKNQPGPLTALNNYLALTYYLFYPAMQTSPAGPPEPEVNRIREGQWEAITIFLKGDPDFGDTDQGGRPDFPFTFNTGAFGAVAANGLQGLTPRYLAYSQGYNLGDDNFNPLSAEVRPWPTAQSPASLPVSLIAESHPMVFVTAGTHRNLFSIDATVTPGTSTPSVALGTTGAAVMGAAGSAIGVCAGIAELPPAAVVCIVIAAVVFLIGLILFILSFLFPDTTPTTETVQSTQPGSDVARDDGPAAIPTISGTTVSTNASSVAQPTLRLISEYQFDPTPPITTYPLPSPAPATGLIEMPSWWAFPGRWGVRITPLASGGWDSGSRRSDPFGRTRAYWNAYQLVAFIAASAGGFSL